MASDLKIWWSSIGFLAGVAALVSLIQRILEIGLRPLPSLMVDYYRRLMDPIATLLEYAVPWDFPRWYVDAYTLSFVLVGPYMRSFLMAVFVLNGMDYTAVREDQSRHHVYAALGSTILSFVLLGFVIAPACVLLFVACAVVDTLKPTALSPEVRVLYAASRRYLHLILMGLCAAFIFFGWNFSS